MGSIAEYRWQRKESVNFKGSIKTIQSEKYKEQNFRDNKIMKGLTFVSLKFQKERRKCDADKTFEEIAENVPHLVRSTNLQSQEVQRSSKRLNPKKSTPRCIIIKLW